ncbi:Kynurenine 3-monooxygenase [compost metagenome]
MLEGNIYDAENTAPQIFTMLNGGKIMAFGNKKDILIGQKGNGEIGFYISFKANENWAENSGLNFNDKTQVLEWFRKEYSEWNNIWEELLEKAATPFIPRPIYCMPLDQTWEALPNLTMLGDAAHVMPPFAGEGANMAMLDALELSECLASDKYSTFQEAIFAYETNMHKRASCAAKESLDNGDTMHSENALNMMLNFFGEHTHSNDNSAL